MAVDPPVLTDNYFCYLRDMIHSPYGSVLLNPSAYQIHNAYVMRAALTVQGYCPKAMAGIIGCSQQESGITTGAIQKWSALPNGGETIADVPNSYMIQYYTPPDSQTRGYALGLLQWDGLSNVTNTHKLVGWCEANGYNWYDGNAQMARLDFEYNNDSTYHFWVNNYGPNLTWAVYKDIEHSQFSNYDAGECAAVWDACWERSSGAGREIKRQNALFWYQYFIDHPTPPPTPPDPGAGLPPWMYVILNEKRKVTRNVKRIKF